MPPFRAGPRNETYDSQGAAHVLRVAAGLTTKNSSAFAIIRNLQEIGGSLSCSGDRETISYTVELTRDNLDTGLKYLSDVVTAQSFKPWEVADTTNRLRVELGQVGNDVWAVELLHRASFRGGLGNSLFCPAHQVGKVSAETLQHFVSENFTAGRAAVSGVGVSLNTLTGFAQNLKLGGSDAGNASKSQFVGGQEVRVDKSGNWASVAIAAEGASWENALVAGLFKCAAGTGRSTKWGNVNGTVGKAVSEAMGSNSFGFSALSGVYSDAGLAGFVLTSDAANVGKGIDAAVKALRSANVSDADLTRAKAQLKACYLGYVDQEAGLLGYMGQHGAMAKSARKASEIAAAIDAVSASDVNSVSWSDDDAGDSIGNLFCESLFLLQFAKKVASSKLSVGAIGNLRNVPHVEQL